MPTVLFVHTQGDGAFEKYPGIEEGGELTDVAMLEKGMTSGLPSVALAIRMPDGRMIFAETSLKLFVGAAQTFVATMVASQRGG